MSKKKTAQISVSQEEHTQAQHVFEHYQQIANDLHASKNQQQAETALAEVNNLPESAQIALLKELAKENQVAAADVLTAINQLSTLKSVRKEARRSLIRLEGAKIYSRWESPVDRTLAIRPLQLTTNPPRFWKGLVSDTRAEGEVQLLLFWEQGDDYKDVRILGFLLEFWHDGVKDFFTSVDRKRGIDKFIADVRESMPDVEMKDCSLARGRRLLQEALAANQRSGTTPYKDYRFNLSLIKQLILEAPDLEEDADLDEEEEEEEEESVDLHGLDPEAVVADFVEYWVDEDYGIAYDLLSQDSPLREGLSRDEWIERRESWAADAHPDSLQPNFLYEHEPPKPMFWLPNPVIVNYTIKYKKVEASWSIRLDETPLKDTLPELPKATAIYEETGRHWFWSSYALVQENDDWRIQNMTDEGLLTHELSAEDLQAKIDELENLAKEFAGRYTPEEAIQLRGKEASDYFTGVIRHIILFVNYTDALVEKLPLDRPLYEQAAAWMATLGYYERCLVYLLPLTQQLSPEQGLWLRRMADVQRAFSENLSEEGDEEHAEHCLELAIEALQESLTIENSFEAHISLAELFIEQDEQLDEAKEHLRQAKGLITKPEEEAHVELHLGEIAAKEEEFEEALTHYQRTVELQPNSSDAWFDLGETHEALEHFEEAETSYKRAIELEPDSPGYYYTLSELYLKNDQSWRAKQVLEQGLAANPDSAAMHIYIVGFYIGREDYSQADIFMSEAERLEPDSLIIHSFRLVLNALRKPKLIPSANKPSKSLKQKKKRR
jgi:tetratricopeptide (TPR) repeat protein